MAVLFREHRGSLDDSMKTLKRFNDAHEMKTYIKGSIDSSLVGYDIELKEYSSECDSRIGWSHTNIIQLISPTNSSDTMVYGFYTIK